MMPSNSTIQILLCILAVVILMRPGRSPFRKDASGKGGLYSVVLISGALAVGGTHLFIISAAKIHAAFPAASPLWLFAIPLATAFCAGAIAHRRQSS